MVIHSLSDSILMLLIYILDFQTFLLFLNYYLYKRSLVLGIRELLFFISFTVGSYFAPSNLEYPFQIILEFIFLLFLYKQTLKKDIKLLILYHAFTWVSLILITFLEIGYRLIFSNELNVINPLLQVIICSLVTYIILSFHILRKTSSIKFNHSFFPIIYLIVSILELILLLNLNRILSLVPNSINSLILCNMVIVPIELLNIHLYSKMLDSVGNQMKQQMEIEKYKLESDFTKQIDESLRQVSKIRHDFKNQLIVLHSYAEQNRIEDLKTYILKIQDQITTTRLFNTSNPLISSILNSKNMICERNNIKFNVKHAINDIHIGDYEIMTILGNILDNAITATSKLQDNKYISLSIIQIDSYIEIVCENNHLEKIKETNGTLHTTKSDTSSLHGLGISNIKDCVDSLNGSCNIDYTESTFKISILLPNY